MKYSMSGRAARSVTLWRASCYEQRHSVEGVTKAYNTWHLDPPI